MISQIDRLAIDRVTPKAAGGLEQLFATCCVALRLRRSLFVEGGLPEECRDGLDLFILEPESWHLGSGPEGLRVSQPHRDPILLQLGFDLLQVGSDFFLVLEEVFGLDSEFIDARIDVADCLHDRCGDLIHAEAG